LVAGSPSTLMRASRSSGRRGRKRSLAVLRVLLAGGMTRTLLPVTAR
jgi:hypothetical protein